MPNAPGVFTTIVGGGADVVASAMWKPVFGRSMATTNGPAGSLEARVTAATGVMAASRTVDFASGKGGAAAPSTPVKIRLAMIATPNAGDRDVRVSPLPTAVVPWFSAVGIFEAWATRTTPLRTVDAALPTAPGIGGVVGARRIRLRIATRAGRRPMRPPTRTRSNFIGIRAFSSAEAVQDLK